MSGWDDVGGELDQVDDFDSWNPVATSEPATPTLEYPDLTAWVEEWFAQVVRRRLGPSTLWCDSWWAHPEAASRLGSLWAAWETAQAEGGAAMSLWWVSHFGPQWAVLVGTDGPFSSCANSAHRPPVPPLPTVRPTPEGTNHDH